MEAIMTVQTLDKKQRVDPAVETRPLPDGKAPERESLGKSRDRRPSERAVDVQTFEQATAWLEEAQARCAWTEIVNRFHPFRSRQATLAGHPRAHELRALVAFALSQLKRFAEALDELGECLKAEPESYRYNAAAGYQFYNALMAEKNREIDLGDRRLEVFERAESFLAKAETLYPGSVVDFYRHGMLYHHLSSRKDGKAIPLFRKAVESWERLSPEDRTRRHKDFKNYVKSIYHLAKAQYNLRRYDESVENAAKCIEIDRDTDHEEPVHKFYLLGKCRLAAGRPAEAYKSLKHAARLRTRRPKDYVYEILCRCCEDLKRFDEGLEWIEKIPRPHRKPYIERTRGKLLLRISEYEAAEQAFRASMHKDRKGRHKALLGIGMARYFQHRYAEAIEHLDRANEFKKRTYLSEYDEALYFRALCHERLGDREAARRDLTAVLSINDRHDRAAAAMRWLLNSEDDDGGEVRRDLYGPYPDETAYE